METVTDPRAAFRQIDARNIDGESYAFKIIEDDLEDLDRGEESVKNVTVEFEELTDTEQQERALDELKRAAASGETADFEPTMRIETADGTFELDVERFGYELMRDETRRGYSAIFPEYVTEVDE